MHPENSGPNRRILIVDDNAAIHEDFRKILAPEAVATQTMDNLESLLFGDTAPVAKRTSFELTSAYQGQEALIQVQAALAAGKPFAMAFVDVRMPPGWDGIETISRLWAVQPELQVVICTAYSDFGWDSITERLGASDSLVILKKPFDHVEALQLAHALTNKWTLAAQAGLRTDELEQMVAARTAELEAAQEQRRQAYKMEAVGRLAAGIAHDFNNLLTVIQGYASLQLAQLPAGSDVADSLTHISTAADRAANITRKLLAFGRKQIMIPQLIDLNARLTEMEPILRPLLGAHITLRFDLAPDLPAIHADASNLDQIILNLTLNARDALPHDGSIVIRSSLENVTQADIPSTADNAAPGSHVRITVADTGVGMDEETARHLFEPFFTTKEVGQGTGMGLAMVQGIAQQHRGWITVETAPKRGTSFHIYLPAAAGSGAAPKPAVASADALAGSGTVLIAEDEEAVSLLATCTFEEHGFKVLAAPNATEALRLWDSHATDVVLLFTDMVMPGGMSGYDLAQRLRQQRPTLPVIYSSGYSRELLTGGMELHEGVNYLPKPYRPADLSRMIATAFAAKSDAAA
jgi:signal transduction histidine kinase